MIAVDDTYIALAFMAYVIVLALGLRSDPQAVELTESAKRILDVSPFDFRKPEVRKAHAKELEQLMMEVSSLWSLIKKSL